ncbi:hypothetical protein D1007_08651 [Hordeum vulgare]|nr:hypothetical protein D1007_08651 [Hordeum vulgare]
MDPAESSEHGGTLIWAGAVEERPASGAVYPFFLHCIYAGLVPPFTWFFTAVLEHYRIEALHLQPNSILLLSVFSFYCEAFVGVQPSVALLRHFFSLRLQDGAHLSACISFVADQRGNVLLKAGKKVENFRHCWVLVCLKDANPQLEKPKELSEKTSAWSSAKLSDPQAVPMLDRFSRDISAKRLTEGIVVKEFLAQRLSWRTPGPCNVISPGPKRKKMVVKTKATLDAPSALNDALLSVGGEEEARGAVSLGLVVEPLEPPKHPEASVGMPLPVGQACEGPQDLEVSMPEIVELFSGLPVLHALLLQQHHPCLHWRLFRGRSIRAWCSPKVF